MGPLASDEKRRLQVAFFGQYYACEILQRCDQEHHLLFERVGYHRGSNGEENLEFWGEDGVSFCFGIVSSNVFGQFIATSHDLTPKR